MNSEHRRMKYNVVSLRKLALDILELYEESEGSVIETNYLDVKTGLDRLKIEVEEFKNEINGFK